ncbi:MAG TPA: O-antigen ligase family protein [Mycobacteriales bacterium]|nr:O-antigen ligase family protein [Mycobacteriales bacterium]
MAVDEQHRRELPRLEVATGLAGTGRLELLEHVAMLVALAVWAVPFTRATGGRGVHNELVFAVVLLLVLPAVRAWRGPTPSISVAAVTAIGALLVCAFAPSGWYGSNVAAGYAIAAGMFVAARRYVRDSDRRLLVCAAVCLAGVYQFSLAFSPWWGNRNPASPMDGTFYWYNPYAAFLMPGAILGLGLILQAKRPWTFVGWVSVPVCVAGIVFSTSRATMAALAVALVLVFAFGVRSRQALGRAVGTIGLAAVVVLALPGPPFFPSYTAPWTATTARDATGQTLTQNGTYRTEFWREAVQLATHHPIVGSGFNDLAVASALYTPSGWVRSPQAHNGFLQAFSDGGLVLGLPFVFGLLAVLWWALRPLLAMLRRRVRSPDVIEVAAAVALLAAYAHSAVDFDWSHPTVLVELALIAACIAPPVARSGRRALSAAPLLALGGVLVVSIPALHEWQIDQPNLTHSTGALLAAAGGTFGDYRPAQAVLNDTAYGQRVITEAQAKRALALTAREATVDIHLALLRDAIEAKFGLIHDAVAAAQRELRLVDGSTAPYVPDLVIVRLEAGDASGASSLLASDIARQVMQNLASPDLQEEIQIWAQRLGTGASYACELDAARPLLQAEGVPTTPPTTAAPTAACPSGDQGGA